MIQVLLFSATMPDSVAAMAAKWLCNPEVIKMSEGDIAISRSVVQVRPLSHNQTRRMFQLTCGGLSSVQAAWSQHELALDHKFPQHGVDTLKYGLLQVVHVCAEHKKPQKLLKHLAQIKEQAANMRNPPRQAHSRST